MGREKGNPLLAMETSKKPRNIRSTLRFVSWYEKWLKRSQQRSHAHVYAHGSSITVLPSDSVNLYTPHSCSYPFVASMTYYTVFNGDMVFIVSKVASNHTYFPAKYPLCPVLSCTQCTMSYILLPCRSAMQGIFT